MGCYHCAQFLSSTLSNLSILRTLFLVLLLFASLFSFCQLKIFLDTSKLINGNGIAYFQSTSGKNFGYETYKNGHINGKYYLIDTLGKYALKGELRYHPSCINLVPGVKFTYLDENKVIQTDIWPLAFFKEVFKYDTSNLIKTEFALAPSELAGDTHPDLNITFSADPAIVPIGRWQRFDLKRKYVFTQFNFDECGNTLLILHFNPDGSILNKYSYKPKK